MADTIRGSKRFDDAAKLGGIAAADTIQLRSIPTTEINDIKSPGAYVLSGTTPFTHVPEQYGTLIVFGTDSRCGQLFVSVSGKLYNRIYTSNAWTAWYDIKGNIDAALPKSGGTMTGDITPSAANTCHVGTTSKPWEYVTAKDYYAHGGRFISRNPSNMTGDFIALDYANHKIQNAHTGDALKLWSSAGVWCRDIGGGAWTQIAASAFAQQSSIRFKDILGNMPLERARQILDLDIIKFRYKAEYDNSGKTHYGVKAEQVEDFELYDILTYDMDGLPFGVDYSKLTPYLLEVAKDHDGRIAALETENAALKALLVAKGVCTQEEIDGLEAKV